MRERVVTTTLVDLYPAVPGTLDLLVYVCNFGQWRLTGRFSEQ